MPLLASIGWLLAGGFAAGGALRVAQWLGDPVADSASYQAQMARTIPAEQAPLAHQLSALAQPQPLHIPTLYTWVALVAAVLAVVVVPVLAGAVGARLWRLDRMRGKALRGQPDAERRRKIGRIHDVAELTDVAPRYLSLAVLVACTLVVVATVGWFVDATWPQRELPVWTDFGSWAMGVVALLLVALGRAAYRTPHLRRTVGILWDVASFWPRAAHPLAPPCYTERVLPELVNRARLLTAHEKDCLLLSAHSQGSVIALATVLQLPGSTARRTCLLTYGCPLSRLYAAFFPGYVNREAYNLAAERLGGSPDAPAGWPWRNLYRRTDPIGRWVLAPTTGQDGADELDHEFVDPVFARPPGDLTWPPALGHSNYWDDPQFHMVTNQVLAMRT